MEISTLVPKLNGGLTAVATNLGWVNPETCEQLTSNRLVGDINGAITLGKPNSPQKGFQVARAMQNPLEIVDMVGLVSVQWGPLHTSLTGPTDVILSIDFGDGSPVEEVTVADYTPSLTTVQLYATTHTYAEEGAYTVTATINHSATESSVVSDTLTVEINGGTPENG